MKKSNDWHKRAITLCRHSATPSRVFCTASVLSLIVLILSFVATRGDLISRYFWWDQRDTGMDFFHSMEYVRGRVPYEQFDTLYPPLANLFFLCLYYIVPVQVSANWAPSFAHSIQYRGSYLDLRTYQAPMLLFILVLVITAWMLVTLIICMLKRMSYKQANSVALCILLSPGMMMAFERGNILFFVVPLCIFFVHYRKSENWMLRELALVALAIAAGLKLYPAFFGVLLLKDKKYAQAARAVLYGILSVILPCFAFKEGLSGIPMWLSVVMNFGGAGIAPHIGTSFANILHRIALYAQNYLGIYVPTGGFAVCGMVVSLLLLFVSLFLKKDWQSVLAITFAVIMFSSNGQYIYGFVCVPAIFILMEEEQFNRGNIVPYVLTMLLCIHLPLFYTHLGSYPDVAARQLISVLIVCWCFYNGISNGIIHLKQRYFRRKNNGNLEE